MGSEEGDGMANVDAAASWQQYYTWCGPYSHPHSHSHPHGPATGQPHTHSHPHFHHPNHLNQYQAGQYQQQSLTASTANASAHYSTSQQYHLQLQPAQTPPLHQQQQFHPVRGQTAPRRAAPYDRT
ncbi:PREDICTED: selenoprotein P-like, partial [Eufriesea mexicana]|uniref:selenoprotein P-like n=1 Tax=Eufriesea mexicana TaxID=516756 RepID=UPI00083C3005